MCTGAKYSIYINEFINNIDILLTKYKIIPDCEILNICILTSNYELINKILQYKLIPDKNILYEFIDATYTNNELTIKIIELLIQYGLVINKDDISYLSNKNIKLNDLERFIDNI